MAKPEPAHPTTTWERFVAATKQVLSVSKEELGKREVAWKKRHARKRRKKS